MYLNLNFFAASEGDLNKAAGGSVGQIDEGDSTTRSRKIIVELWVRPFSPQSLLPKRFLRFIW